MAYEIRKSKEFLNNVLTILAYIEKEWGIKSSEKFQTILDSKIDSLFDSSKNRQGNYQEKTYSEINDYKTQ